MKTVYIADDGKQFDDICECEIYEWVLQHPLFKEIKFLDKDDNEVTDLFCDESYGKIYKVIIKNKECTDTLLEYAEYMGFCDFMYINDVGVWTWVNSEIKFVKQQ